MLRLGSPAPLWRFHQFIANEDLPMLAELGTALQLHQISPVRANPQGNRTRHWPALVRMGSMGVMMSPLHSQGDE